MITPQVATGEGGEGTGKETSRSDRWNEGLELARAIAIILVVYAHGTLLLSQEPAWLWFNQVSGLALFFRPGWWGVRIFLP